MTRDEAFVPVSGIRHSVIHLQMLSLVLGILLTFITHACCFKFKKKMNVLLPLVRGSKIFVIGWHLDPDGQRAEHYGSSAEGGRGTGKRGTWCLSLASWLFKNQSDP